MALTQEDLKMIGELLDKKLDERLQPVIERLDKIEERLDKIEARLDQVEQRLDKVEKRLDRVEKRLANLESHHGYENLDGVTLRIVRPGEEI